MTTLIVRLPVACHCAPTSPGEVFPNDRLPPCGNPVAIRVFRLCLHVHLALLEFHVELRVEVHEVPAFLFSDETEAISSYFLAILREVK